jgi:RNAse (barnase) inhibitor barstar
VNEQLKIHIVRFISDTGTDAILDLRGKIDSKELLEIQEFITKVDIHVAKINYSKLSSINESKLSILEQLYQMFYFPDYFGMNWDAVDECIQNLSWLPAKGYCCFLINTDEFQFSDNENFKIMASVFEDASITWKHRDTPFKLILCSKL